MAFSDPILYTVLKIDGDYAWLRRVTDPAAEPIMVALALLPDEVAEGCRVQRVMFDYSMA
ncbi:MAG: chorismate--pyruvate lyase [Clostridiales bacterium]|nr:chorismate--pyruvate lyase [Clostridiales bacterium]